MNKMDEYRRALRETIDPRDYLLKNSNLPGPRGNLELAQAAALEISSVLLIEWAAIPSDEAPSNTALEFLSFCGVLGQGRLFLEGDPLSMERIVKAASDTRWRTREASAMALQFIGKQDIAAMLRALPRLANGNLLEQRCAVAAICEPVLLKTPETTRFALDLLDRVTLTYASVENRKEESFIVLKKGLSYGWSVAVSADPEYGKPLMEKWLTSENKDIQRVMQENLKKNRLVRMDQEWVDRWKA